MLKWNKWNQNANAKWNNQRTKQTNVVCYQTNQFKILNQILINRSETLARVKLSQRSAFIKITTKTIF